MTRQAKLTVHCRIWRASYARGRAVLLNAALAHARRLSSWW
eukprot:CAMPEP_0179141558 /NCGR_PEP_ID=MMETSP0796-20121207/67907_1 /TAXON_ID=73915 /ORGANISM="Pyrodinium bahamense, Strain pbaha01" /LENGTH=40 /DNA_ID= /DNA_START= /DNA_END= /DNA_ORIENTATION=